MSVKIYHNPRCSKSRQTLEILKQQGTKPRIIEYLKDIPDYGEIASLLDGLGFEDPRRLMRTGESLYKELDLANQNLGRDELIAAMVKYPILIERPIVVTEKGACLGRPPENVMEIL